LTSSFKPSRIISSPRRRGRGYANNDPRAFTRLRFDLGRSPHERGTLAHPDKAQTFVIPAGRILGVEADAVVFDDERDGVRAAFEEDGDARRVGVLGDVVQGFLCDAVEHDVALRRGSLFPQSVRQHFDGDAEVPRPILREVGERVLQAEVVEGGGA
jgi:hypothetical protein